MNRTMVSAACLLAALSGSGVYAQEFPVTGKDAVGRPGETVFVVLEYDYGGSFAAIAEDLQLEYQFGNITFAPSASTMDAAVASNPKTLPKYIDATEAIDGFVGLREFAQRNRGSLLINESVPGSQPGYTGWAMSFTSLDAGHPRNGNVLFRAAFDISASALPGQYHVSFTEKNLLADWDGNEYVYPDALRHLTVTVVPEPAIAWMLLPGLVLVGLSTRRRVAGRG